LPKAAEKALDSVAPMTIPTTMSLAMGYTL
jgi:hypothetical protein